MYCRMNRGVYMRANGELACYCGPGEEVVLGRMPVDGRAFDFVPDFYRNAGHARVREAMASGLPPHPGVCLKCIYFEPLLPPRLEALDSEIEWMHLEATSNCNLDCRFCIPRAERATFRTPPHFLPFGVYATVLDSIARAGMSVRWMYFSGRGEPTLHPRLWEMVALAKKRLGTDFLVNTNGNARYDDAIVDSGLDKIKIAIDGVDQQAYAHYRRGGRLDNLLALTRGIAARRAATGATSPRIIWQYILFAHNDSPRELETIQRMALDLGVDEVLFKSTFSADLSTFPLADIPRVHPGMRTLDLIAMVSPDLDDLDRRLAGARAEADPVRRLESLLHVAKSVFRAFILGIERKQLYNAFGGGGDVAMMTAMARRHPEEYGPLLERLGPCLEAVAGACHEAGRPGAARWYEDFLATLAAKEAARP